MLWENLKCQEFPEAVKASKGVCVIPIGAMEKHGLHLGVGIDSIAVEEVARLAAEKEPVVVFPTFWFGQLNNLQHMDGSVCLSTKLMLDYLGELCREIARSGFKKILFLNGHGGNPPMLHTLSSICREEKKDYVVAFVNVYGTNVASLRDAIRANPEAFPYLTPEDIHTVESYFDEPKQEGHADMEETLALLGVRPEAVDVSLMDKESGLSTHRMDHLTKVGIQASQFWFANFPNHHAASFHPGANQRLGKAFIQIRVEDVAGIFKVFKDDEELLKQNEEWNNAW